MNKYALGIDLGGTGTKFGLVNNEGNVLRTSSIPTQQYPDIDEYCDALCAGLNRIVEEEGLTFGDIIRHRMRRSRLVRLETRARDQRKNP